MKKRSKVGLAALGVSSLAWLWFNPLPANGATLQRTAPYQAFGNLSGVGDCQYETAANLILAKFPKTKGRISASEVIAAYSANGSGMTGVGTLTRTTSPDLWAGQVYLMTTGFAGHKAASITQITEVQAVNAANHGGVEVSNMGPVRTHMFAIIAATRTHVVIVDDGYVYHYSWAWLNWAYTQQGETLTYFAVRWA
jgi:hypothetical protein